MAMKQGEKQLEAGWKNTLKPEFESAYMHALQIFLRDEKRAGQTVFPEEHEYFRALELTPLDKVRVVILGQDPYHGPGQAHGLCFSVRPSVRVPPSLRNIYKELTADLGIRPVSHGFLENWAHQGVLLINSVFTVRQGEATSHRRKGWETFSDAVIRVVNDRCPHVVFMLWGGYAQKKATFVDADKHLVLKAAHPSPLSAYNGFFGCRHFSKANQFLVEYDMEPIDWQLPDDPANA